MSGIATKIDEDMGIKPSSIVYVGGIANLSRFYHHSLPVLQGIIEVGEATSLTSLPTPPSSDLLLFLERSSIVLY